MNRCSRRRLVIDEDDQQYNEKKVYRICNLNLMEELTRTHFPTVAEEQAASQKKIIEDATQEIINEFEDIFSDGLNGFRTQSLTTHVIELDNPRPFREKFRAVPYAKRLEFKQQIEALKAAGMIVDSKSPYSSPTNLVKKSDGSIRITIDYKKLNSMTVKDNYPLPIINDLFYNLINARFFSKLDFESGYYQLQMDEASRKFTAFACEFGFFEWSVMPMGLRNAGATFQREMDEMLGDLIGKCCNVYMDDIIIYSRNAEEHAMHLRMVLQRIRDHKMKIKKKKCEFFKSEIQYLGHTISEGVLKPQTSKTEALFRYPKPTTQKQLLSFLGLASYYRKFIRDFATTASPLYTASIEKKLVWNEECAPGLGNAN